ncbi:unnamed protein product [Caenorhabditis nigoni]
MDKIPEFLKNNDHYLKSCILYEVLQKKPIHNSYQNFCSLVGQDTMGYPDFEFWYHRFCQGELDFDYDRSKDPVPKTLMDMPVKLMQKITEELRPFERQRIFPRDLCLVDSQDVSADDVTNCSESLYFSQLATLLLQRFRCR